MAIFTSTRRMRFAIAVVVFLAVVAAAGMALSQGSGDGLRSLTEDPNALADEIYTTIGERVRNCMVAAGFPYELAPSPFATAGDDTVAGYGYATDAEVPSIQDPNVEIVAGLGDDQRIAYETALYGDSLTDVGDADIPEEGCLGSLQDTVADLQRELLDLDEALRSLEADVAGTPAFDAAAEAWSDCMAGQGYDFARPADAEEAARAAYAAALEDDESTDDTFALLADEEASQAAADFACRAATIDPVVDAARDESPAMADVADGLQRIDEALQ